MTSKIPPSLNWLIKNRARLLGELKTLDYLESKNLDNQKKLLINLQNECKQLKSYIADHEIIKNNVRKDIIQQLEAINTALGMHDIPIDIELIQPIATRKTTKLLSHGLITQSIYECLKIKGPLTKKEIRNYVMSRHNLERTLHNIKIIDESIYNRIKNLTRQSKLICVDHIGPKKIGRWKLNPIFIPKQIEMITALDG